MLEHSVRNVMINDLVTVFVRTNRQLLEESGARAAPRPQPPPPPVERTGVMFQDRLSDYDIEFWHVGDNAESPRVVLLKNPRRTDSGTERAPKNEGTQTYRT
eukprot:1196177-Prorocentrum_minimum.AAC.8